MDREPVDVEEDYPASAWAVDEGSRMLPEAVHEFGESAPSDGEPEEMQYPPWTLTEGGDAICPYGGETLVPTIGPCAACGNVASLPLGREHIEPFRTTTVIVAGWCQRCMDEQAADDAYRDDMDYLKSVGHPLADMSWTSTPPETMEARIKEWEERHDGARTELPNERDT